VSAEAGMHLAGLLPAGMTDTAISHRAAANGISVMPLSICCLKRPSRGGLVLGYGGADAMQIEEGVRKLKIIIESERIKSASHL
jgi:GntR family transcriptional regulator / MocR family aminotransferase